ncbi:MAG TPA: hypothetical protein VGP68_12230 [Gemmataceae bacterium]|jgi:hypothetical protein|nr:hypothetical protein [Gemmataceae bacterium]
MNWLRRWCASALVLGLALTGHFARGQAPRTIAKSAEPSSDQKWQVDRTATLSPRAESKPALAYRLFPVFTDRKDGNAVPIYLRLNFEQNDAARRDWTEIPKKWLAMPIEEMPLAEAKAFLQKYKNFFRQFELGARRKTADWNYTLDQGNVIEMLLPDMQSMRGYVPMMVLKARVELAEGNFAAAAHWLETGFAFSQHVGNGPFIINRLVGIASANQFADCLLDFVAQPEAPNLYWPLTALPRPLIDLRDSMELEQQVMEMQFSDLAEIERQRSPEQWDATLKNVRKEVQLLTATETQSGDNRFKTIAGASPDDQASKSPDLARARKYLLENRKLPAAKVAAMPAAQVLLLYMVDSYHEFRDDAFKAGYLPYPDARRVFAEAEARRIAAPPTEARRLPDALLPAIDKVQATETRLERKIAALRVIEALRLHAAAHDGRLPDKLSDVALVPVPDDPATGKPFGYQRDGDIATVTSRIPGEKPEETGLRYRVVMKTK